MFSVAVYRDGSGNIGEIREGLSRKHIAYVLTPSCLCDPKFKAGGWISSAAWAFPEGKAMSRIRQGEERPPYSLEPGRLQGQASSRGQEGKMVLYTQPHSRLTSGERPSPHG